MQFDIVIIGGGLTGLLTLANFSKQDKLKVLLLESNGIGKKSSGRSVGGVIAGPLRPINIDMFERMFYIHRINNDLLREFVKKENLDITIDVAGSMRLACNVQQLDFLQQINKRLPNYSINLDKSEITGLLSDQFYGGLFISGDYCINPYDLILSLQEKYKDKILEEAKIQSISNNNGKIIISFQDGTEIIANKVVYTNNIYYDSKFFKPQKNCIFCLKIPNDTWRQQILANFIFNDCYFRVVNEYIFISVPNITNDFKEDDKPNINNDYLSVLHSLLHIGKPSYEYSWSQVSARTVDNLPIIGSIKQNEYVNIGYDMNGVNCSFLGSLMVVNEVLELTDNKSVPWSELFHINRFLGV